MDVLRERFGAEFDQALKIAVLHHHVTPMLQEFLATYYGPKPSEELTQTMLADAKRLLLGRAAEPAEIASTAIHVALEATAMTGSAVTVDLGYTAR